MCLVTGEAEGFVDIGIPGFELETLVKSWKSIKGMAIGESFLLQGQGEPSFKLTPFLREIYPKDGI